MLQVEDNTPILEGGLYPVLEATGTPGLTKALKEVGEMKDEDASAAIMDFERLWSQYQLEREQDSMEVVLGRRATRRALRTSTMFVIMTTDRIFKSC